MHRAVTGPDRSRCSRVRVRRVVVPKNIQPARTKCSWTATLTGKLSSFGFDPRRSSNFSLCFSTLGLSLTARAEAMTRHASIGESSWCHKLLLNPSNSFFIWSRGPPWVKRHEPNRWAFRPQKLVEASSNSTTINLLKLPKMWRLLMRVEKRLMVFSFVPEPSRRNIQHLKDYPVFKVFFFDFRTLAVSWSTRYASAQRAAHCDSSDSLQNRNFKSARTPLRTSKSARTVIPTNFYADELIRGEPQIENSKMNYDARVWVRPRTTSTTRVELIRCYTGWRRCNRVEVIPAWK